MSTRTKHYRPWNIKPGMLIKVCTFTGGSDWVEVTAVDKQVRWFGPGYMWKLHFREFGRETSIIRFKDDKVEVRLGK